VISVIHLGFDPVRAASNVSSTLLSCIAHTSAAWNCIYVTSNYVRYLLRGIRFGIASGNLENDFLYNGRSEMVFSPVFSKFTFCMEFVRKN
jgi:hypothetical protein